MKTLLFRMACHKRTIMLTAWHFASCTLTNCCRPSLSNSVSLSFCLAFSFWFGVPHLDLAASNNVANFDEHGRTIECMEGGMLSDWAHTIIHCPSESFDGLDMSTPFMVKAFVCVSGQGVMPKFMIRDILVHYMRKNQDSQMCWQLGT